MTSERFISRALPIKDLLLPPEAAGQQGLTAVRPEPADASTTIRNADPEEEKPAPSANAKKIPFEWDNSGSKAAASRRKDQARASQRRRNRIKQNKSLMADVDAYSSEVGKLSDLVLQQRAQLLILNEFKELVLAKQTERALAVLGGRPQPLLLVSNTYRSIKHFVRYCGNYVVSVPWNDPCMDFEVYYKDGTAGQVRWRVTMPLKLQATRYLDVQEDSQKAELAKGLLPTAEW
ncbi:hypothetical protein PENARI_c311G06451, partial [Penicillium arizonense]